MRTFRLSIAVAVGLWAATFSQDLAAQDAEGGIASQPDDLSEADSLSQDDELTDAPGEDLDRPDVDSDDGPVRSVEPPPPELRPPDRLEDLIPEDAVENPADWAVQGTDAAGADSPAQAVVVEPLEQDPLEVEPAPGSFAEAFEDDGGPTPIDEIGDPLDVDETLEQLAIPTPDPLEPDEDVPSFAEIEAPDLGTFPALEQFRVSDELVLAFPQENERFPEQTDFVERFRELSAIEELDTDNDTIPQLAARARADEELLVEMLEVYGYYDAEVIRQLSGGRRGVAENPEDDERNVVAEEPQVRFDILPGVRYRYGDIDLGALDTLPDPDGDRLREMFGIRPGDPLYLDRIVEEENELRVALAESGYPFSEVNEPSLLIDHAREEGDLTLPVETGGKYVFGGIVSDDPAFLSSRHLERIARFDEGDVYQASLQSDLRRAIIATGLVSSATLEPVEISPPSDGQPGVVALQADLERAPLRTISGAIGYGTEDGFKVEAAWEHRNLFPPEGALRLRGILGTREQLASVTFRRNNFLDRDQVLTIDAYASHIETEAVDARTVALRGSFERVSNLLFQKPLSWLVGAEVLYTDERNRVRGGISRPRQEYLIGSVFGSATIDASDDLLDPTRGYRITGYLAPEVSRSLSTETFYLRAQVDGSYYQPLGSTVLAGRLAVATIQGAEPSEIAPSRRLYSGGGGSVRGYGFQAIGPLNDLAEPTGGGSLVEGAIEARIQTGLFDGAVEVVPFVDAGSVSLGSTPDFRFVRYGAGVGIRYKTSFGPIRVDVGVPLNPREFDAPVVVYVSLGQAF
ncbi:MAG: BamA/TamA family outer membrane protein [Erythrobacter sp.]